MFIYVQRVNVRGCLLTLRSGQPSFLMGLLSCRWTILKAVLLYYLDETSSGYKMYIDILPTHCSYM